MADLIAGDQVGDPVVYEYACRVAEAQLDLQRVRIVRAEHLAKWWDATRAYLADFPHPYRRVHNERAKVDLSALRAFGRMQVPAAYLQEETPGDRAFRKGAVKIAKALGGALRVVDRIERKRHARKAAAPEQLYQALLRIDRYERRALSRRRTALRALSAAMQAARRRLSGRSKA